MEWTMIRNNKMRSIAKNGTIMDHSIALETGMKAHRFNSV